MGFLTTIAKSVKKAAVAKIATVAAVVVVGVGGVAGLAYADVFTTPERAIEKATKVMEDAGTPALNELFGLDDLQKAIEETGMEAGLHLKLEDISGDELGLYGMTIPNVGVDVVTRVDTEDKQDVSMEFELADTTLLTGRAYIDKEKIQLAVPQLFSDIWYIQYGGTNFFEDLKNSYLLEYAGYSEEEFDALFGQMEKENLGGYEEELAEIAVDLMAARERMLEQTVYEKLEKQEITVDGEALTCKVYTATVPEEALKEFTGVLSEITMEVMKEVYAGIAPYDTTAYQEFEQEYLAWMEKLHNLNMTYYIYNKRIVRQEIFVDMEESPLKMELLYAKEGNPYENMTASLEIVFPEETVCVTTVVSTENTEDVYGVRYDITVDGETIAIVFDYEKLDGSFSFYAGARDASLTLEGAFGELEKGKKLGLELEKISLKDGEYVEDIELNASLYVKVLEGTVTPLEGNEVNLLTMTAEDVQAWTEEVTGNIYQMLFSMMGLFE